MLVFGTLAVPASILGLRLAIQSIALRRKPCRSSVEKRICKVRLYENDSNFAVFYGKYETGKRASLVPWIRTVLFREWRVRPALWK
jgi:hypothetical protein